MKRVLVLDNLEVTRETVGFLLERDFVVEKDNLPTDKVSFAESAASFDLLIIGVPPVGTSRTTEFLELARTVACPVLFLVGSPSLTETFAIDVRFGCLAIPFDPYRLRAEVDRLVRIATVTQSAFEPNWSAPSRLIEYPFVSRVAAILVQRFVWAGLPVLIFGEIGCGQERITQAMAQLAGRTQICLSVSEINESSLAKQEQKLSSCADPVTLTIHGVDRLTQEGQQLLFDFLRTQEQKGPRRYFLATASHDLLERVYSGNYLAPLYYRLATLTMRLTPLRERREDIAILAQRMAELYASDLKLTEISFSQGAKRRLENYLWFGNVNELEAVVARTLAIHRKSHIEDADLIFDMDREITLAGTFRPVQSNGVGPQSAVKLNGQEKSVTPITENSLPAVAQGSNRPVPDLRTFIHELAHEIKNPMVTIKTFAQLLADRYQDEGFRARYKEVVDEDIGRIDQLLQIMLEFADFGAPRLTAMALEEQIHSLVTEMSREFAKYQVAIDYNAGAQKMPVYADETHVRYIFKNIFLAALNQAKAGTPMNVEIAGPGRAVISFTGEANRVAAVPSHLGAAAADNHDGSLPLRILLAKQIVERNAGKLKMVNLPDSDKNKIEVEFPVGLAEKKET